MIKIKPLFKKIKIFLFLFGLIIGGCENEDIVPDNQGVATLSSPTVESDGSLSINATARFDVAITDIQGNPTLIYEWTLVEGRGTLIVEDQDRGNEAQTSTSFVRVRGDVAGEETLRVKVLNEATGNTLGEDMLSFEITAPTGVSSCFDEPLLFFRNNNWENPVVTAIGLESDTRKTTQLSPQNWLFDFSKNGNWFLRLDYSDDSNHQVWMDACDGSESKKLAEGPQVFGPTFDPEGASVYYSQYVSYPAQTNYPHSREIARVNVETGEHELISDLGVFSSDPILSPDGKWIAFEHSRSTFKSNGSFDKSIVHLAVIPSEGGPATLLTQVKPNDLAGFDWSPDSDHLIFNWYRQSGSNDSHTNGIYRVNRTGSGSAALIFAEPKGAGRPIYYANGTRIAFHGHPAGNDTQNDIWSTDANGSDLQRITDERFNVFLSFIWEP